MSVPSMKTCPELGLSRPINVFRNTDLPVPDGPSITEISPAGRVSVTSFQIIWLPNFLVSPSTTTSTPTEALLACRGLPGGSGRNFFILGLRPETHSLTRNRTRGYELTTAYERPVTPWISGNIPHVTLSHNLDWPYGGKKTMAPLREEGCHRRDLAECHLTVTVAPAASRASFAFSAASLVVFSR